MQANEIIGRLERFPAVLRAVAACVPEADARWKPAPEHWSILEVCAHVADEEREDFRPRLEATLLGRPWPALDLDKVAERRGYNRMNLEEVLTRFERQRTENLAWLRTAAAASPDWSIAHQHPKFGPIRAGDLLSSWAAHDALHLRQIAKRLHGLAARDGDGFSQAYAGEW